MSYNDFEVEFSLKIYRLMTLSFIVHAERLSCQIYSKYMFNIDYVKPNSYSKINGTFLQWFDNVLPFKRPTSLKPTAADTAQCASGLP